MTYVVVENTPGYLPEDDDPPTFEEFHEAQEYLGMRHEEIVNETFDLDDEDGNETYNVEPIELGSNDWSFTYTDPRKMHDLGRIVEIMEVT